MIDIVTDQGSGGTFLSWTLHYLAGHERHYLADSRDWRPLTENPLTGINAHGFMPNQPNKGYHQPEDFTRFVNHLHQTSTDTFHTLYFHPFIVKETTEASIKYVNNCQDKVIVVDTSNTPMYHCSYRKRSSVIEGNKKIHAWEEIQKYFIKKYFNESKLTWDKLNLNEIWDCREFLALNFRPFYIYHVYDHIDKTRDHIVIRGSELWTVFDQTLNDIFDFCEINIDQERFEKWKNVYNTWKPIHCQKLRFGTYFEDIISGVLNNYNIDLLRFDLDIEQEAAIQHALIYKHNLNLKTWQLEKFINTKQLHSLLEPNIHPLRDLPNIPKISS